jgi:transglutaminase-like putative cysteine protease
MGTIRGWVLILGLGLAQQPAAPLVEEVWEVAHSGEARIGFVHTTVEKLDGGKLRTTSEMELTFRRQGALVRVRQEQGSEETADGKVLRVFMRQHQGANQQLVLNGVLEDGKLHVVVDGGRIERRLRWSEDVVGLYRRMHEFEKLKPKPGKQFSFSTYEPTVNTVVTIQAEVRQPEEVPVLGKKEKLLRVELTPGPIEAPGIKVQLPASTVWLDERFVPVRRKIEVDGLGPIVLTRTTRAIATAGGPGAIGTPDINLRNLIVLNRAIKSPYATRWAVYRVTLRDDPDPGSALVQDAHQDIRDRNGNTFELHVHPARPGPASPPRQGEEKANPPGREYLASCYYINSDDSKVRELAERALGQETDPWKKAQKIERWVNQYMRVDNAAPLVPAGMTAVDRRGDCRHFALLTAALCRAAGIPARTALGLIYVAPRGQKPALGFHMWTEVWVAGQWLGLDGTLGQGGVSAAHLKISQHSWHETRSLTPLLPVSRVLGKLAVEVVRFEGE